jgi:hypothetical protein
MCAPMLEGSGAGSAMHLPPASSLQGQWPPGEPVCLQRSGGRPTCSVLCGHRPWRPVRVLHSRAIPQHDPPTSPLCMAVLAQASAALQLRPLTDEHPAPGHACCQQLARQLHQHAWAHALRPERGRRTLSAPHTLLQLIKKEGPTRCMQFGGGAGHTKRHDDWRVLWVPPPGAGAALTVHWRPQQGALPQQQGAADEQSSDILSSRAGPKQAPRLGPRRGAAHGLDCCAGSWTALPGHQSVDRFMTAMSASMSI